MDEADQPLSIWDKIQLDRTPAATVVEQSDNKKKSNSNLKVAGRVGTILGPVFWVYSFIQVFIFDLDRYIFTSYLPGLTFLIDYKFFVFLLISALIAVFFKKFFLIYVYILFFPIVLLLWKIPKVIYRFRSWIVVLGLIETFSSLFYKLKNRIVINTILLFSILAIATTSAKPILMTAMLAVMGILLFVISRTVYLTFKTSVFFSFQAKAIKWLRNTGLAKNMISVDDKIKTSTSKKLTKEQSNTLLTNMQMALLFHRTVYFWAFQLEKYRASKISFILSGLSYVWLFIKLGLLLGVVNYAIYKVDPNSFTIVGQTSLVDFVYYAYTSLFFNEISGIMANSNFTLILRIISGIVGYLLIGVLILNFMYVAKQSKTDDELDEAIKAVKSEGRQLEKQIEAEYMLTIPQALKKLEEFKTGLLAIILKISSQLPDDYK